MSAGTTRRLTRNRHLCLLRRSIRTHRCRSPRPSSLRRRTRSHRHRSGPTGSRGACACTGSAAAAAASVTSSATGSAVLRLTLRVAIVAAVVIALVAVEISSRSGVTWRLITFTYQANVLAAAYYLWTLASPRADARVGLRGAAVLYVVIAGIVWNLFLTNHSMGYTAANFLLHVVVPMLAFTDWLLIGRGHGTGPVVATLCLAGVSRGICRVGAGHPQQCGSPCAVLLPRPR